MKTIWNRVRAYVTERYEDHKFGKALTAYARLVCVHKFVASEEWPFTYYYYSWKHKGLMRIKMWSVEGPNHRIKIESPDGFDGENAVTKKHFVRGIGMISALEIALLDIETVR